VRAMARSPSFASVFWTLTWDKADSRSTVIPGLRLILGMNPGRQAPKRAKISLCAVWLEFCCYPFA
jgi:hypothetical protein